nr:unnamed protein product [Spirometra erinaceieuropaei]
MERNKCVSLLQVAIRVSTDTRERLRQQANESEILLTLAQKRENDLLNMRKTIMNLICQRDHKRHEYCKMAAVTAMQDAKREQMRQAIARLNLMFNQAESSIIAMKKACERNARIRNERAILLIERNQEVYLLQEREKAQDTAMAAAKMALRGLEDEYACSQLYLDQVKRFVHLVKEQVPHKNRLEGTVRGLIQQLIGLRARKAQLVSWFEDPDRVGRLRLLGGVDPSQSELWVILGKLEKRLSIKEEDLSEKNLIYEAVCRLVDALRVKTDASRWGYQTTSDRKLYQLIHQVSGRPSALSDSVRYVNGGFIADNSAKVGRWREHSEHHLNFDAQPTPLLLSSAAEFLP